MYDPSILVSFQSDEIKHYFCLEGCKDASSQFSPSRLLLFSAMATSSVVVGIGIFVKIQNPKRQPGGKFKNPLRNINLTIATVILFSTLLHTMTHYVDVPADLLFPRVPMGFDMVVMAALFFFSSPDMKAHAVRRFPFLNRFLRGKKANCILPQPQPAAAIPIAERRNEMQLNDMTTTAGASSSIGLANT